MSDQAPTDSTREPHWVVKAIVIAFLTHEVTVLASGLTVVLTLLGTGLLRVGTSTPGLIVLGIAVLLFVSAVGFVVGVRLMLSLAIGAGIVLWKAGAGLVGALAAVAAESNATPAPSDGKRRTITVTVTPPAAVPQPAPTPSTEDSNKPPLKERLYGLVGLCLWYLLVPKRYRRALRRRLSDKTMPTKSR